MIKSTVGYARRPCRKQRGAMTVKRRSTHYRRVALYYQLPDRVRWLERDRRVQIGRRVVPSAKAGVLVWLQHTNGAGRGFIMIEKMSEQVRNVE